MRLLTQYGRYAARHASAASPKSCSRPAWAVQCRESHVPPLTQPRARSTVSLAAMASGLALTSRAGRREW
jgi:hypothetical protein